MKGQTMTKEQFNNLDFAEAIQQLESENDTITSVDILKDFIKENIDNDNYYLALHVLKALAEDTSGAEYFEYDYCMGALETPTPITSKEDIEHYIYD